MAWTIAIDVNMLPVISFISSGQWVWWPTVMRLHSEAFAGTCLSWKLTSCVLRTPNINSDKLASHWLQTWEHYQQEGRWNYWCVWEREVVLLGHLSHSQANKFDLIKHMGTWSLFSSMLLLVLVIIMYRQNTLTVGVGWLCRNENVKFLRSCFMRCVAIWKRELTKLCIVAKNNAASSCWFMLYQRWFRNYYFAKNSHLQDHLNTFQILWMLLLQTCIWP